MPIIIDSYKQYEPAWFKARLGNPGASNASKILTNTGDPSKQTKEYMYQLAGEVVAGKHEETYQSTHMTTGLEREDEARMVFAMNYEVEVDQVALVYKDDKRMFHASPDGIIGTETGIEIKCPMIKTHVKYLLDGKLPTDYFAQIQMSLYVCEREHWHFCSYYPDLPLFTVKVYRDEKWIARLEKELESFCFELSGLITKLKGMR
jgi:putative phage-type endonuclease